VRERDPLPAADILAAFERVIDQRLPDGIHGAQRQ